jgi:hypothetical protein
MPARVVTAQQINDVSAKSMLMRRRAAACP